MNSPTTKPLRLFLVRHAEATANVGMRYLGSRDDALTERGVWQAEQLAQALQPLPLVAIYSSALQRSLATATAIAAPHGLKVEKDVRLREGSFGDWEGMTRAELLARSQSDALLLARWESDPSSAPPGGESLQDVQQRVVAFVNELTERHTARVVVLVSHVGPMKTLLCHALGVPLSAVQRMFLDPATISVVDWGPQPMVRLFNSHHHLGWEAARWMDGW